MSPEEHTLDKAGQAYWDTVWAGQEIPDPVNPRLSRGIHYLNLCFHNYFRQVFPAGETAGKRLLEIGCGRSAWLPYFAREFDFKVCGLDYSEIGCAQANQILTKAGVEGAIVLGDLFDPPEALIGTFDWVVSFGVAEHFEDTAACLAAFARYLRPGGKMITIIPNMCGLPGAIQKRINRSNYDIHVPLDRPALIEAHHQGGLEMLRCDYWMFLNLGVLKLPVWKGRGTNRIARTLVYRFNLLIWLLERNLPFLRPNPTTSPYLICLASRPCA